MTWVVEEKKILQIPLACDFSPDKCCLPGSVATQCDEQTSMDKTHKRVISLPNFFICVLV